MLRNTVLVGKAASCGLDYQGSTTVKGKDFSSSTRITGCVPPLGSLQHHTLG